MESAPLQGLDAQRTTHTQPAYAESADESRDPGVLKSHLAGFPSNPNREYSRKNGGQAWMEQGIHDGQGWRGGGSTRVQ
jgi:hypothetical protein